MGRHATTLAVCLLAACATVPEDGIELEGDAEISNDDVTLAFDIVSAPDDLGGDAAAPTDATDDRSTPGRDAATGDVLRDAPADRGTVTGPCATAASCAACASLGGCGWCGGTSVCVPGTALGPTGGSCFAGWAYSSVACQTSADPCATLSGCAGCLARSGCGWCGASSACATANASRTGPASGTCAGMWAGVALTCTVSVDPCASVTDCGGCANGSSCGWCRDSMTCMSGTATGPSGGRTCGSWAWNRSDCRNRMDSCDGSGNCATCNLNSGCGWCSDSDTCHSGGSSGPRDRACGPARWDSDLLDCL